VGLQTRQGSRRQGSRVAQQASEGQLEVAQC
jgi:hypothetical protein